MFASRLMLSVPAGTARLRVNAQNFQDAIIWARASNNNVRKIVVEAHHWSDTSRYGATYERRWIFVEARNIYFRLRGLFMV